MNRRTSSIIYVIFLSLVSISLPLVVLKRTQDVKSGWKNLSWGSTENQVREWVKKNNTNYLFERCPLSHYGVACWKLSWKAKRGEIPLESIEFQFKDGRLCAVVETERTGETDPAKTLSLGQAKNGTDIKTVSIREKGLKYALTERVFYYEPESRFSSTKVLYAVSRLVKIPMHESENPEEVLSWRLTKGSYSPSYYAEAMTNLEIFPSARF